MRRREIIASWKGALALLVGALSFPSLAFWWRSARVRDSKAGSEWTDLGPAGRVEDAAWQGRTFRLTRRDRWRETTREEAVYVRRLGDQIEVLSPVCTHTGCLVRKEDEGFACPCHRSRFDADGKAREGPAPRPLDRLESKVERGHLLVRYQRFRPGSPRKEAVEA
jgi:Rieske Fe-S protein